MRIDTIDWNEFEPYLRKARGQSIISVKNHKSRFNTLVKWFGDKEFNAQNFSVFLNEVENLGLSASYQNNCLKLVKHIAYFLKIKDEFIEFKYIFIIHLFHSNVNEAFTQSFIIISNCFSFILNAF